MFDIYWCKCGCCFVNLTCFFFLVDEDTNEAWDNTCNSYDDYEELKENIYGKEFEQLALNSIQV